MNHEKTFDVSWSTILKVSLTVISFYLLYLIRDILIWFIFALIIAILCEPAIRFLQKLKIPRFLAVIFVYVTIFSLFSLAVYLTIPVFIPEIQQFLQSLPQYFEKISPTLQEFGLEAFENLENPIAAFGKTLETMATNILNVLFVIFGGIFTTLFVIILSFFLSLEENIVEHSLSLLFPKKYENYALRVWRRSQRKVTSWFGTRILACSFVGLLSFLAFWLFNVKYPFTLALLAGVLNFIPYLGPFFTGILIFLFAVLDSIPRAIFALSAFLLIQLIENNILTPILTKKFVGLSPSLVLIALAIGGKIWGFLGAILAIPLAGILFEFIKEFLERKEEKKIPII